MRSDNGSQYSSSEFISFASSYGFQRLISSPKFPQTRSSVAISERVQSIGPETETAAEGEL